MLIHLKHLTSLKNIKLFAAITGFTGVIESAYAGANLPSGGGSTFQVFVKWLQNFVDFMTGPFGTAAVAVSIIVAFVTWSYAPKEGLMGTVMRSVVSGIVIINVLTFVGTFSG